LLSTVICLDELKELLKRGFQPYVRNTTYVTYATQGFTQGTQYTQEVANYMAGICHMIWLA